ncbi:hypothetical protein [Intrasporangium chromatireducens]|uniref:hypothetical protein n=1 Tax=Intrasporangium chromatireducens TaxID=1386088 RepID=UPI0012DF06E5|nr:hypothetical protein [Intrasporangium chromatireducens]
MSESVTFVCNHRGRGEWADREPERITVPVERLDSDTHLWRRAERLAEQPRNRQPNQRHQIAQASAISAALSRHHQVKCACGVTERITLEDLTRLSRWAAEGSVSEVLLSATRRILNLIDG